MKNQQFSLVVGCFLLVFSSFRSHSADNGECERKYIKPKHIKYMSPEQIRSWQAEMTNVRSMSPEQVDQIRSEGFFGFGVREVLHSLRPRHLFFKDQKTGEWGDLKWTKEQFQALELNSLHPKTLKYILTRPDVLNLVSEAQIQNIPKNTLRNAVFGDKASELSETIFHAALKVVVEVEEKNGIKYNYLNIDQIERLVRNPYIINPERFDRIKNTNRNSESENALYKRIAGKEFPEDLRVEHFRILVNRLSSLLEMRGECYIRVIGIRNESLLNRIRIANPEGFIIGLNRWQSIK